MISRGSILENLKREETEFSTDGKPYTKNQLNPSNNENEFQRFCKTLNMIETERKKQIEILKVINVFILTFFDSVAFRMYCFPIFFVIIFIYPFIYYLIYQQTNY